MAEMPILGELHWYAFHFLLIYEYNVQLSPHVGLIFFMYVYT